MKDIKLKRKLAAAALVYNYSGQLFINRTVLSMFSSHGSFTPVSSPLHAHFVFMNPKKKTTNRVRYLMEIELPIGEHKLAELDTF